MLLLFSQFYPCITFFFNEIWASSSSLHVITIRTTGLSAMIREQGLEFSFRVFSVSGLNRRVMSIRAVYDFNKL